MPDKRIGIQTTGSASRSERASGIQTNKPIPPWERAGYFRLDCESDRSTLLLFLAFPTFFPYFVALVGLASLVTDYWDYYRMSVFEYVTGQLFHDRCLVILTLSACGIALALPAWLMSQIDLHKMRKGLMDPTEKNSTAGAWFFARLGLIVNGCITLIALILWSLGV